MTDETANPHELRDDEFDALEEILTSDAVPDDCMNLEMLDGYLAAVVLSPSPLGVADWMPAVWSAHDDVDFASGSGMQHAIRLVLRYYNELVTTLGAPDGWEPFCYAGSGTDGPAVGEEWIEGFLQGLELWPENWAEQVPPEDAEAVTATLQSVIGPWEEADDDVSDNTRLAWLAEAGDAVLDIRARWIELDLPQPQPVPTDPQTVPTGGPGRNEPCPCGSGKKFKKCCGPRP